MNDYYYNRISNKDNLFFSDNTLTVQEMAYQKIAAMGWDLILVFSLCCAK